MPTIRKEEEVAREVMARALGVSVSLHDDGSSGGMHDFGFVLPDGRTGAAEMTAITDQHDRQWVATTDQLEDSRWAWMVKRRGRWAKRKTVMSHLRPLAALAEEQYRTDIGELIRDSAHPSARWFRDAKVDVYAVRSTQHPGRVYFVGDDKWAFGAPSLDTLLGWLEEKLTDKRFDGDFAKINNSGCGEQHLVLRVDIGNRIPAEVAFGLMEPGASLPTRPPAVPGRRLTGLWLIPEYGWSAIYWTTHGGWGRADALPRARDPGA